MTPVGCARARTARDGRGVSARGRAIAPFAALELADRSLQIGPREIGPQRVDESLPVLVMTAWGSVEGAVEAMRRGARDYIEKPWDNERLVATLRTNVELAAALRKSRRLEDENRILRRDGLPTFIADSAAMRPVVELMERDPSIGWVHSDATEVNPSGETVNESYLGQFAKLDLRMTGRVFEEMLVTCFPLSSTVAMRRDCLAKLGGFFTSESYGVDLDFYTRASIFFPSHSGVRPTMSPATKTAMMT